MAGAAPRKKQARLVQSIARGALWSGREGAAAGEVEVRGRRRGRSRSGKRVGETGAEDRERERQGGCLQL